MSSRNKSEDFKLYEELKNNISANEEGETIADDHEDEKQFESFLNNEYSAFENCTGLTSIYIPNSVTSIARGAFQSCTNLTIYCEQGSYAETYAKENNISVTYTDVKDIILSSEVLTKTNTTEFTPTEDYQPATKKYVDSKGSMRFDTDGNLVITIGGVSKKFAPIVE